MVGKRNAPLHYASDEWVVEWRCQEFWYDCVLSKCKSVPFSDTKWVVKRLATFRDSLTVSSIYM